MEIYAEFKPCYKTKYLTTCGFDRIPIMEQSKARFINGESKYLCGYGSLYLTKDFKYVYCFYEGQPSYYRVTNISSKPIACKFNKVKEWYKFTKRISELRELRKNILLEEKTHEQSDFSN